MRDKLFNSLFFELDHARQVIRAWAADYGETAFLARLQDAGDLRRSSYRNRPSRCTT